MGHRVCIAAVLGMCAAGAWAQTAASRAVEPLRIPSLQVFGGMSWPLAKPGLTEFWRSGPAAAVGFSVPVSRRASLGLEVGVAAYWFRASHFADVYPGVSVRNLPIAHTTIMIVGRFDLMRGKRLGPYASLSLGVAKASDAVYREIVDSVRTTYFAVPGRTRLAGGLTAGLEYVVNKKTSIDGEARLLGVANDQAISTTLTMRCGVRFTF